MCKLETDPTWIIDIHLYRLYIGPYGRPTVNSSSTLLTGVEHAGARLIIEKSTNKSSEIHQRKITTMMKLTNI